MTDDALTDVEVVDAEPVPEAAVAVIPHPKTGEAIEIVASTPSATLAELRDAIVEHEQAVIKAWKYAVDAELTRRLDFEGRRSADVGPWRISTGAPTKVEWDARGAWIALQKLVRAGLISKDRARECVQREVTYTHKHGPLSQLMKHADARVRDAIAACRSEVEVPEAARRVSVKPNGTGR